MLTTIVLCFFEARSEEDLLDEDEIAMASKVEVLEEFVRHQQEQIAAMNSFVEQSLNLKQDPVSEYSHDGNYSLKQDDFTFSPRLEEVKNRRNIQDRIQARLEAHPIEPRRLSKEKTPEIEISPPPITTTQYNRLTPEPSPIRDVAPVLNRTTPEPITDSVPEQQQQLTNNNNNNTSTSIVSKEDQLRRKIIENLDDAFDLANKVDEIEIVIQERSSTDDEHHPYYDEPFDPNEPLIEEIGYDQYDEGEYDDESWEDEYSGSEKEDASVEDEVEAGSAEVSDVDDTELMRRLDEKYGKLD